MARRKNEALEAALERTLQLRAEPQHKPNSPWCKFGFVTTKC